ncbi:MAG: hypothetical protein QME81_04135 [bacterium]|nr:hypothetical protein [bacterium]
MPTIEASPVLIQKPQRYEKNIQIFNLRDNEYQLSFPIPVHLEYENGAFAAVSHDLNLFGWADTEEEAITDLCHEIVDYYIDLKKEHQNVINQMSQHWNFLQRVMKSCS